MGIRPCDVNDALGVIPCYPCPTDRSPLRTVHRIPDPIPAAQALKAGINKKDGQMVGIDTQDPSDAKSKKPKSFEIRITYNGIEKDLKVSDDELVSAVLSEAIKLFPISEAPHLLALFDRQGIEITNETQTAEEAGLKKNSRLQLRPSAVKGG